jgi:hypothetical protein
MDTTYHRIRVLINTCNVSYAAIIYLVCLVLFIVILLFIY